MTAVLLAGLSGVSLFGFEDGDLQYWPRISIQGRLNNRFTIGMENEIRIGAQITDLYFHHTDFGLQVRLASWMNCSVNYRSVFSENGKIWIMEKRPHFNFIVKWKAARVNWSHRSRFECRMISDQKPIWRYRDQMSLSVPTKIHKIKAEPYVSDEINIDDKSRELNRNRLYLGVKIKNQNKVIYDFYYLQEKNKKDDKWTGIHVIGSKLIFTF